MPESGRLRYQVTRRVRPEETFFLLCRAGPQQRIRAMESLEISSRRPNANVSVARPVARCKLEPKTRSRAPKHLRSASLPGCKQGPFDSSVACACSRTCAWKLLEHDAGKRSLVDNTGSYNEAYRRQQSLSLASAGEAGLIDIYDPLRLLLQWLGGKSAVVA